jgi:N-acetylmuramoyl-L-alanine amidase
MHRSSLLLSLTCICLFILVPILVLGKSREDNKVIPLENQYTAAKTAYNKLETDQKAGDIRENWAKCADTFKTISLSAPHSEYAPKCLLFLGRIYQQMYSRFKLKKDLDEAISSYTDLSTRFPDNKLSDDSLWAVANIYLNTVHDPKKAVEFLNRIVTEYPKGDMQSKAADQLKALAKDHTIPAPQVPAVNLQTTKLVNVLPVKYWSSHDYTRIVIDASGPVTFREQLLEQVGDQPRRLYIDFLNSYVEPRFRAPVPIEDGLLKRIRTGQYSADTVRVVLDIESISSYKVFSLPDPFRVVVDVRGQNKEEPAVPEANQPIEQAPPTPVAANTPSEAPAENPPLKPPQVSSPSKAATKLPGEVAAEVHAEAPSKIVVLQESKKNRVHFDRQKILSPPDPPSAPNLGKAPSLAQQLGLRVKKIVLDPGHGGKDPGAMAYNLKEKDIVLKVAQRLAPILEKRLGCKVILTRKKDAYIPLEERTAIANTNDADLFISLHINSSPSSTAYGIETYFLNLTTNPEAMRVAALENATSTHQMSDLQNILSDILKNSKINESSRLAQQVHTSIVAGLEKNFSNIKSLGVKQAPFYVLIGAEMPAILVEMSFISNPNDAQHLKNDHFLDSMANDISAGIQSYVNTNTASL